MEEAFSKVKVRLRKAAARTREGPGGSDGRNALGGHVSRRRRMVRPLWLRVGGPTFMNTAVSSQVNYTLTNLAEHLDSFSHDTINT